MGQQKNKRSLKLGRKAKTINDHVKKDKKIDDGGGLKVDIAAARKTRADTKNIGSA
jgi:hypothetical protein